VAKRREHRCNVVLSRADVPVHKPIRVLRQTVVVVFQNRSFLGESLFPDLRTMYGTMEKRHKRDSQIVNK
jgi:hypothetical protein